MAAQEFVQQPEPLDQNAEPVASVEYPFVPEERETAQHESPVPDSVANPPTYTEAVRPINQRGSSAPSTVSDEGTPLLNRPYRGREGTHVRQQRGVTRALLLWLGIGQWYSGLCIFFSFIFFTGGIVLVVLCMLTLHALYEVKLTTAAAGVVFVLLSILWPCAWLWNQWNMACGCSYAPLVTYSWFLSLAYTAIVGALFFGVSEHYDCVQSCKNCTFEKDPEYPCQFVQVSLWTLLAMLLLMVLFVLVACMYCTCTCLSGNGGNRDRRIYSHT